MAMTSGNFSELLLVRDTYDNIKMGWDDQDPPSLYPKLFTEKAGKLKETKDLELIAFGEYLPWSGESEVINPDEATVGYTWTYNMEYYALQFAITQAMRDFEQWDFVQKCAKALGRSARQTIETHAFNVFNRAFSSSYPGGDGVSLCNASHPNKYDSSTKSNVPSVAADLTPDSLNAAINYFDTLTDERGITIALTPRFIVTHPNNRKLVYEVLKSNLAPYTSDNQVNFFSDLKLDAIFSSKLVDTDAWFLVAPKERNGLQILWKHKPYTRHYVDDETLNIVFQGIFCRAIGFTGYHWIYGSAGA